MEKRERATLMTAVNQLQSENEQIHNVNKQSSENHLPKINSTMTRTSNLYANNALAKVATLILDL